MARADAESNSDGDSRQNCEFRPFFPRVDENWEKKILENRRGNRTRREWTHLLDGRRSRIFSGCAVRAQAQQKQMLTSGTSRSART
ncbi:Hypothetical protein NTJ_02801 [Nesidiocoris tenuis]|uniref:Uncharacterized protein n=1 Tax=Nesidiocoris tenuis TaxID=355587 RepID=A0ABN7ACJ7_9HEMI|nr:Hypothetical protein NTJ_02801 [Nesidiocoris tenuis]